MKLFCFISSCIIIVLLWLPKMTAPRWPKIWQTNGTQAEVLAAVEQAEDGDKIELGRRLWIPKEGDFVAVTYPNRNKAPRIAKVQGVAFGPQYESGCVVKCEGFPALDLFWIEQASLHHKDFP
jgi:hypothetical protein